MENLLPVLLIIFSATLVQSTFSFGGALISLPLLALFIDLKVATPLMTMLSTVIAVAVVITDWRKIQLQSAWRLIVSALIGIPFGVFFLKYGDERILKTVLAMAVIGFTVLNLMSVKKLKDLSVNWAFLFGFVSGVFGGAFNISGPPVVLYGALADWGPEFFRATIQSYALVTNLFSLVCHLAAGNLSREVLHYFLLSLPVLGISIFLGKYLNRKIPVSKFTIIIKILLLALGLNLFISSWF